MEPSAQPKRTPEIRNIRGSSRQPLCPIGESSSPTGAASIAKIVKRNFSAVEVLLSQSACRTAEMYVHLEVPLLKERASVKLNVKAEKFQEVLQDVMGSLDTTLARSQAQGSAGVAEAEEQEGLQDLERFKEDCSRQGQKWRQSVEKLRSKTLLKVGTLEEDLNRSLDQLQALRAENRQLQEELAACKAARRPSQRAPGRPGSGSAGPTDRNNTSQLDPRLFPGVKVIVEQPTGGQPNRRDFNSEPTRGSSDARPNGQPQAKPSAAALHESLLRRTLAQTLRSESSSRSTTDTTDGDVDYQFAYEPIRGIKVMLPTHASRNQAVPPHRRSFIDDPCQVAALRGVHPSVHHPRAGSAMSPPAQPTEPKRSRSLSATLGRFFRYATGTRSSSQSFEQVPRAWP